MALDTAIVYATYEDDGAGPKRGGQPVREPSKQLLIFPNMSNAKEYERALRQFSNGTINPRLTAFYSQDEDEILVSCFPARVVKPLKASD